MKNFNLIQIKNVKDDGKNSINDPIKLLTEFFYGVALQIEECIYES